MNKEKERFDAQEAPDKNTDAAFVKVGTDGKPQIPTTGKTENETDAREPKEGTLADR